MALYSNDEQNPRDFDSGATSCVLNAVRMYALEKSFSMPMSIPNRVRREISAQMWTPKRPGLPTLNLRTNFTVSPQPLRCVPDHFLA